MTRFVVDCGAVLHLVSEAPQVRSEHELLAPTLLRSQTLSALHEAVHRGELPRDAALKRLARVRSLPIRLLGDAVLRRRASEVADELGWAATYDAEYVALTLLQADAPSRSTPTSRAGYTASSQRRRSTRSGGPGSRAREQTGVRPSRGSCDSGPQRSRRRPRLPTSAASPRGPTDRARPHR
jgi:predicted nucleic acid-binding protein